MMNTLNLFNFARLVDMKTVQLSHNIKTPLLRTMLQQQLAKNMRSKLDMLFSTKYVGADDDVVGADDDGAAARACGGSVGNSNKTKAPSTTQHDGKQLALSDIVFGDATPQRTLSTDEYAPLPCTPSSPQSQQPTPKPSSTTRPPKLVRTCSVYGGVGDVSLDKRKREEEEKEEEKEDGIRLKRSRSISVAPPATTKAITPTKAITTTTTPTITTPTTTPTTTTTTPTTNKYTVVPVMLDGALRLVFLSAKATAQMTANGTQSLTNNLTSVLLSSRSSKKSPQQHPQQHPPRLASGKGGADTVQRVQDVLEASALVPAFAL